MGTHIPNLGESSRWGDFLNKQHESPGSPHSSATDLASEQVLSLTSDLMGADTGSVAGNGSVDNDVSRADILGQQNEMEYETTLNPPHTDDDHHQFPGNKIARRVGSELDENLKTPDD